MVCKHIAKGSSGIAIAGAGMTGAYLYRLLSLQGEKVDIYDFPNRAACGLSPCAWGTSAGYHELVEKCGLLPQDYLLKRPRYVWMNDHKVGADLMTFDKPRLIKDMLLGARIHPEPLDVSRYARVVDATGTCRAFLPPIKNDLLLPCIQYKVQTPHLLENRIHLRGVGYAWCFPLSQNEYHMGCGNLRESPHHLLRSIGWFNKEKLKVVCGCTAKIRLTGPAQAQPFVSKAIPLGIWGVGEAVGCVAPLAGDGIVPGMRSVQILLRNWNNPEGFTADMLREFAWMEKERRVVDRLLTGRTPGLTDALILKANSKRMGMHIRNKDAIALLKHLR